MPMETVVVVAIGVLAIVFLGSLIALIVICQQRYCRRDFLFKHLSNSGHEANLISNSHNSNNMELDDVRLHPDIDKILADAQWVDDVTGLIPHCLAILKGCHHLTERLVAATMAVMPHYDEQNQQKKLWEIIKVAQKISPRVDDVLQSMYPPLDSRLLEARCLSLILSVTHLSMVICFSCHIKGNWVEDSLDELDDQLKCRQIIIFLKV
ncbi:hypothetical protein B4U80_11613 [Leptotrombidium deliense]|uniref:Transmembrane protein 98 n=1 Tax=Leptotrombidium deliense TaxID=299467 RepID=A0A443SQQ8_9ACAR|nr:hypothetical protein B4U80_11613 [Leptotrombidium deliense]